VENWESYTTCNRSGRSSQRCNAKVLSKRGKQTTIHRPLQKFISFEIAENNVKEDKNVEHDEIAESTEGNETQHDSLRRSTRKAAVDGQNARRLRDKYY
jgi:acyl-CoA hydrolase